jgi:hypothetical protein
MQLQVQAEMACIGEHCQHSVLLVLHTSPMCLRAYHVGRHEGAIVRIRKAVPDVWREILAARESKV